MFSDIIRASIHDRDSLQLSPTLPNVLINLYEEQSFMGSPPLIEYDRISKMFERIPRPNEYDLLVGTSIHTGQRVNTLTKAGPAIIADYCGCS